VIGMVESRPRWPFSITTARSSWRDGRGEEETLRHAHDFFLTPSLNARR
jgi:hypothetical protein